MKVCTTCGTEYPDEQSFCPTDGSPLKSTGGVADLVGSIVDGKFRITEKLGEGGMGAVYLGEHVKMGRMSAIKVMSRSMANDPDAIARFNREASNASRINHNNVCGIYDFGETDDGIIYLAMEFIEGEVLTDLVEREGALAPKRAANLLKQTADALEAAHELGIVHRDLKPDNIMIARSRDGTDLVKVVDFGIAKAVGGDQEGQHVTKTGLVVGTPEYMSPEQLSGDKVDGRSDIYSLALVFFRMLTGTLPFQADTAQEIMIKRLTDEPMKLAEALPSGAFPAGLQQTMDKALQRMPGNRYEHAAQFGSDAVRAASDMADSAPSVDSDGATQLLDSSEITSQAEAMADEGTAIMPGTRVSGAMSAPTPDTPMPSPAAVPKKTPVAAIAAVVGALVIGGGGTVFMINRGSSDPATQDTSQMTTDPVTSVTEPQGDQANANQRQGADSQPANQEEPTDPERVADPVAARDSDVVQPKVTATSNPAWLAVDRASDHLFDLLGTLDAATAAAVRDTATLYFNAIGMTDPNKALAAYVLANALSTLEDTTALDWARTAARLDPSDRSYAKLVTDLERGGSS